MTTDQQPEAGGLSEAQAAVVWFGRLSPTAVIGPVLVIVAAAVGAYLHLSGDPTVQTCDGKVMGPGDSCIVFGGGESFSYEEGVADAIATRWVIPAVCAALAGIAVVLLLVALVTWMIDRRALAKLDRSRPVVLGGSWSTRVSLSGVIGMTLFLGAAGFTAGTWFIKDGWHWGLLFPVVFAVIGLVSLGAAWPRSGALLEVYEDGEALVVAKGRPQQVRWAEVRLHHNGKRDLSPELRIGDTTLLKLEKYLVGRDAVLTMFSRGKG